MPGFAGSAQRTGRGTGRTGGRNPARTPRGGIAREIIFLYSDDRHGPRWEERAWPRRSPAGGGHPHRCRAVASRVAAAAAGAGWAVTRGPAAPGATPADACADAAHRSKHQLVQYLRTQHGGCRRLQPGTERRRYCPRGPAWTGPARSPTGFSDRVQYYVPGTPASARPCERAAHAAGNQSCRTRWLGRRAPTARDRQPRVNPGTGPARPARRPPDATPADPDADAACWPKHQAFQHLAAQHGGCTPVAAGDAVGAGPAAGRARAAFTGPPMRRSPCGCPAHARTGRDGSGAPAYGPAGRTTGSADCAGPIPMAQ